MSGRGSVTKYRTKSGVRWMYRFDVPVQGRRKQLTRRGFLRESDARDAMDAERPRYGAVTDLSTVTVASYLREWVDHRETIGDLRPQSAATYRKVVAQVEGPIGALGLDKVTAGDLDRLYSSYMTSGGRGGQGRSARSTRFVHTILKKAFGDAVRKGVLARNPADGATPPPAKLARPPEPKVWSVDDAVRFQRWDGLPTYRRVLWTAALQTGLRRGELAGLQWSDVDGDRLEVRRTRTTAGHEVVETPPKTSKSARVVHLSGPLVSLLRTWKAEQAALMLRVGLGRPTYVFTDSRLQPFHPDVISRQWYRDVGRAERAEIVSHRMRLHDARHWHATQLVASGVDIRTVADRLGHQDPGFTLRVYGHSDAERDRAAADVIGGLL